MTLAVPVRPMPSDDPKTKTVRLPAELANMLQTIASLKEEMGERFKPVEYLADQLKGIKTLHAETTERYAAWLKEHRKKPK